MKIDNPARLVSFFGETDKEEAKLFLKKIPNIRTIDKKMIKRIILPRPVFGHKGDFGHCLLIAGSKGKEGASILSALGALKTGCGLLTMLIPSSVSTAMLVRLPEAMQIIRDNMTDLPSTDSYNSIGIGPGAGTDKETGKILHELLMHYKGPLVIDADAITLLSKNKGWFKCLGPNVILTPHPAEFDRLTGEHVSSLDRLARQAWFCNEYNVTVILKGHSTSVISNEEIYINTTGNNGMATAGSGDVLTGILASLCAQGYTIKDAAILGTYLHGFAGDEAARKYSKHGLIASEIADGTSAFFKKYIAKTDNQQKIR